MMGVMADPLTASLHILASAEDFESWVRTEQRRIFLLCYRMLQDREEADSASQDAFLKAYKALQQPENKDLDDPGKWLTRIAVNTCLDRLRSQRWQFWRKRPKPEDEKLILEMSASGSPNAEDQMFAREIQVKLAKALQRLSERQRAVFMLRHYEDRSLDQIADILQLDVGTVKAHMSRAIAKLRVELEELYFRGQQAVAGEGR
jgi:RNA polymerase sigma-70 factor (ECF subfamily)